MSSNASTIANNLSPVKQAHDTSESFVKSSKKVSANNKSFLSMFKNSNSRPKIQRQNIISQTSDESLLNDNYKENSSLGKVKCQEGDNILLHNSTQTSDATKMVVSFQTGNSGANHSVTNNSISCRSSNNALSLISTSGNTQTVSKPAAGKVLKNGSSSNSSTKGGEISKKKATKGLEHSSNGTSLNNGNKHHSHQDNHRPSHSAPNSRNNSGGNNPTSNKKEILDMEHSSVSTDSSTHSSNSTASKLSKIGRRLRDSCRNLRGKHSSGGSSNHDPQDYTSIQAPNESWRSKNYVPMDFSGREGRICDLSDVPGNQPTKDGYTYFRRKCLSGNVKNLLTETQSTVHKTQSWFHKGIGRDASQRILATHAIDGAFLVRESSVSGGFVISYYVSGRTHHAQALPDVVDGCVTYSIDDSRTRFFDLLQMVEFYQLNRGSLSTRLTHYIVSLDSAMTNKDAVCEKKATSYSDHEVNTKSNIVKDHQDLILDSNQAVKMSASSEAQTSSSRIFESNANTHQNGRVELPVEALPVEPCVASTTPERASRYTFECIEIEEPKSTLNLSNSSSYSQEPEKQSDHTTKAEMDLSLNGPTGDLKGTNLCDQYPTTNDESINNNNNNNIKYAKKSQLVALGQSTTDIITENGEETAGGENDDLTETRLMEENKNLGCKNDSPSIKNGISDHFELKEYEKEKHPKNHE